MSTDFYSDILVGHCLLIIEEPSRWVTSDIAIISAPDIDDEARRLAALMTSNGLASKVIAAAKSKAENSHAVVRALHLAMGEPDSIVVNHVAGKVILSHKSYPHLPEDDRPDAARYDIQATIAKLGSLGRNGLTIISAR